VLERKSERAAQSETNQWVLWKLFPALSLYTRPLMWYPFTRQYRNLRGYTSQSRIVYRARASTRRHMPTGRSLTI
jgi:hypothetical protein